MSNPLIECIPNFSDARRPEVVEKIVASIKNVAGIHILDKHSDLDHNRTVVTYLGEPAAVVEAAFQAIKTAANLIDLNEHTGEHPRIGATDVVPFVPIKDISIQECIDFATQLAKRVASELKIPIFLYEEAATIPEKQNLENIRRGQYEVLKKEIGSSPVRTPDFGPSILGTAGATVIGVRQPLIAFNIYLTTDDVSIAHKISKAIRNSSGGLRFIKAMGVLVDGRAQVSMNLTNYQKTPIARVVEMVRREAQRYGVGIHHSELVGLIPQESLIDAVQWYLQLDGFEHTQILEERLFEASQDASSEKVESSDFLAQLASGNPTPGGGSAAAHVAAVGAALVTMVSRLTIGRKKYSQVQSQMEAVEKDAQMLQSELVKAINLDSNAFLSVMEAFKLPKSSPEEQSIREQAIQNATISAALAPLNAAKMALAVMEKGYQAASVGNLNAISDAASGVLFAKAGLLSSCLNVRTNATSIYDREVRDTFIQSAQEIENQADTIEIDLKKVLKERGNFAF